MHHWLMQKGFKSLKVFEIFRRALLCRKRIAYIDFSQMKKISPACITVFCCYADLWKLQSHSHRLRACTWTWCPGILSQFKDIGFFDILNIRDKNLGNGNAEGGRVYMGLHKYFVESMQLEQVGAEIKSIRNDSMHTVSLQINFQRNGGFPCRMIRLKMNWE